MAYAPISRFFWTRNSSGPVLPVGETRPSADFYVSADLTRTSERRLQARKNWGNEKLTSRFPYTFWSRANPDASGRIRSHSTSHAHSTTRHMRHAVCGLDRSRGCACYARRRRESSCENRTGTPTHSRSTTLPASAAWHMTPAESKAGAAAHPGPSLLLLLLLVDLETKDEEHRKKCRKNWRAQARRRRK